MNDDSKVYGVSDILRILTEDVRKHFPRIAEYLTWLSEVGWPPLTHAELEFIAELMNRCRQMPQDAAVAYADRQIVAYHCEDVIRRDILSTWEKNPCLKKRLHLLSPAVEAHLRGEYALSVPTVLPQIEGVITEHFGHTGYLKGPKYQQYLEKLLRDNDSADVLFKRFILEQVLAEFHHGDDIPFCPNRHAILHGVDTSFDTPAASLKVILLLDFLVSQIRFCAIVGDTLFHSLDCSIVTATKKQRNVYGQDYWAIVDGLLPCKLCLPGLAQKWNTP